MDFAKKTPKRQFRLSVIVFSVCTMFSFALWDHYFNSVDPLSREILSYIVLAMGILFSITAGMFAFLLESRGAYLEREVEKKITEIRKKNEDLLLASREIKTLQGFIPICANCKKVKSVKGYWQQIEEYLEQHSEARLSHGICVTCVKKLYPKYASRGAAIISD